MQAICAVQVSRFGKSKFFFVTIAELETNLSLVRLKQLYICYGTEKDFDKVYTDKDNIFIFTKNEESFHE